jgi:hypothetical protein
MYINQALHLGDSRSPRTWLVVEEIVEIQKPEKKLDFLCGISFKTRSRLGTNYRRGILLDLVGAHFANPKENIHYISS